MPIGNSKRPSRFLRFGVLLVLASPVHAQTRPKDEGNGDRYLRIDSARDGAVVAPGATLQVTVSSPNRTRFAVITVIMENPIEYDKAATSLPARFAIKIPKDITPGSYSVSAMAGRAGGQLFVATIDVSISSAARRRAR